MITDYDGGWAEDKKPCTLENCGHMRQLDAIVDFLGMARGGWSVLDGSVRGQRDNLTVKAFIERVELTRQKYGSANVAKAFLVFADDADVTIQGGGAARLRAKDRRISGGVGRVLRGA